MGSSPSPGWIFNSRISDFCLIGAYTYGWSRHEPQLRHVANPSDSTRSIRGQTLPSCHEAMEVETGVSGWIYELVLVREAMEERRYAIRIKEVEKKSMLSTEIGL